MSHEARDGEDGLDGREVELRRTEAQIQWRWRGTGPDAWKDLVEIEHLRGKSGEPGKDGDKGEPGTKGLDGTDAAEVEFQVGSGFIQWRRVGDEFWFDLVSLDDLRGAPGKDGKDGEDGKRGLRGLKGEPGSDGLRGDTGPMPDHQWDGTRLRFEQPDGTWGKFVDLRGLPGASGGGGGAGGGILEVVAGDNVTVDNTDPYRPIVSATGGGGDGNIDGGGPDTVYGGIDPIDGGTP